MSPINLHQRLQESLTSIQQGKIMETMQEYYDTIMQGNANHAHEETGRNIEREKQFLSGVQTLV